MPWKFWKLADSIEAMAGITHAMNTFCEGRRGEIAQNGRQCLVPAEADIVDDLDLFGGARIQILFHGRGEHYRLPAGVSVHGIMNRKAQWSGELEGAGMISY